MVNTDDSVMVVIAHPDDETVIGGILGRLQELKTPVHLLCVTRGEGSPTNFVDPERKNPALSLDIVRPRELLEAAAFYGIRTVVQLSEPSGGFTTDIYGFTQQALWSRDRVFAALSALAQSTKPSSVITMLPRHEFTHAHHQLTARLTIEAWALGHLGTNVDSIYATPEVDWADPGVFSVEEQLGLRFPRTTWSESNRMTWSEYQSQGASFHKSQESGYKTFLTDEILLPLYERAGTSSIIRRLMQ